MKQIPILKNKAMPKQITNHPIRRMFKLKIFIDGIAWCIPAKPTNGNYRIRGMVARSNNIWAKRIKQEDYYGN